MPRGDRPEKPRGCYVRDLQAPEMPLIGYYHEDSLGKTTYFDRYWKYPRRQVDSAFAGWARLFLTRLGAASYCGGRPVLFWRKASLNAKLEVQYGSWDFDAHTIVVISLGLPTSHLKRCPRN
jgi:hypothetical protein